MKKAQLLFSLVFGLTVFSWQLSTFAAAVPVTVQGRNSISGTVFGDSRHPVADVIIELLDDLDGNVGRTKTNGSGRFTFGGLGNGRFKIRVLPYGTDYLEQTQEVTLTSISIVGGAGSDSQQIDIYLRFNERVSAGPFAAAPGVIFAQEVPKEAKKLYEAGLSFLREKKEKEGLENLKKAIEVFPDYYLALDRLGAEYAMRGASDRRYFEAGLIILSKALEINPRGTSTAFGLGWTQYHLGLTEQAIENLQKAITLYGKSVDMYIWLGRALKRGAKPEPAEVAFKRANELAKGKSAEAHLQMAELYNDQKRYKEAADELELYLKVKPKEADEAKIRIYIEQLRDKEAAKEKARPK